MHKALSRMVVLTGCLTGISPLWAQTVPGSPPLQASEQKTGTASTRSAPDRTNQLMEHIVIEERNAVIDERRFGGETRSITVAPKGGMPAYDVAPGSGLRSWKIFSF